MPLLDVIQGTAEWRQARLGLVTASRMGELMAKPKSGDGPSASYANYMAELAIERLTGEEFSSYQSRSMFSGTEIEPFARSAYELASGHMVDETGFWTHPRIVGTGASPDGIIGGYGGLVQIKCPEAKGHMEALLHGKIDGKYTYQMQWEMACTESNWCDYVCYNPSFPDNLKVFIKKIDRDDGMIKEMEGRVIRFLDELNAMVERLRKHKPR